MLAATVPAWAVLLYLLSQFQKDNRIWGNEGSPPAYLFVGGWTILLTTIVALLVVLIDHISWRRQQNDPTNKTN